VFTSIGSLEGDAVQANPDGTFSIKARADMAIIAEAKGLRSKPIVVGEGPLTLQLEPTTTISGSLSSPNLMEVNAYALYKVGKNALLIEAPIDRDATFDLAGLPHGLPPQLGLEGPAGDATRRVLTGDAKSMFWPFGQTLDVVVRGAPAGDVRVYVLRGRFTEFTSRADLDARVQTAVDVASCDAQAIGANNTDAGRDVYRSGDLHCSATGNTAGDVVICAVAGEHFKCLTTRIEAKAEMSYPDGRYAAGVTPVVVAF
jgi:hypothetical protein